MWIHIPVGYLHCINNPRTDWLYKTEADAGLGGRALIYPRGKVLGGSSSINGMIYMRGQSADYDRWAEVTGDPSWALGQGAAAVQEERGLPRRRQRPAHGAGGEWRVEKQRLSWQILDAFRDAAEQAGIPKTDDFNTGDNCGCAYFDVNQKRGIRWNTAKAFLRPASKRRNLTIMTGCHVERLVLEDTRAGQGLPRRGIYRRRHRLDMRPRAARNLAGGGRDRLAADPAAVRHRPGRARCTRLASRRRSTCPASARTCRTICSCA